MFLVSNQRGQVLWSAKYSSFRVSSVQVRVAFSSADSNLAKGQFPCSVGKGRKTFICSAATLFSRLLFVLLFRLEDISLANSKLQQSLKVKEEKITELESQYVAKLVKKNPQEVLKWLCSVRSLRFARLLIGQEIELNEYPSCFGDSQFPVLNAGCSFDCICLRW